jgi:hypothetical protein
MVTVINLGYLLEADTLQEVINTQDCKQTNTDPTQFLHTRDRNCYVTAHSLSVN